MITAKLICVFVFAYAKRWFSHDAAHLNFREFTVKLVDVRKSRIFTELEFMFMKHYAPTDVNQALKH